MHNYILFGPPGSGKGTQCANLVRDFDFLHLSTGDMLRRERALGTDLGRAVEALMDAGKLVSDEIIMQILAKQVLENKGRACLFDGIPRTKVQAENLDKLLAEIGACVHKVLVLSVPDDLLLQRLLARASVDGRADDKQAVILHRIQEYHRYVANTLEYYQAEHIVHIDGVGAIEEVFARIKTHINHS